MNCNKPGCKNHFHVTCAQAMGLLCEEAGNFSAVKYCGYCPHHLSQLVSDLSDLCFHRILINILFIFYRKRKLN